MVDQSIVQMITGELQLSTGQLTRAVALLDEGNTIPFIARYRKEMTGGINEEQLRVLESRLSYLRHLTERKQTVLHSIAEQDLLSPELGNQIRLASTLQQVEDLYLPFRPKRRTRATVARERGLEPLAQMILGQPGTEASRESIAQPFLNPDVGSTEDAFAGARDIVAEIVAEDAEVRGRVRELALQDALLICDVADPSKDPDEKYRDYYEFEGELSETPPHRLLAIRRAENEGVLKTRLLCDQDAFLGLLAYRYPRSEGSPLAGDLTMARRDSFSRLLWPSIERQVLRQQQAQADAHAIEMFAANLKGLLLQPPLKGRRVIGIDPAYRTGCKVAVVDETGRYLAAETIYPHPPANRVEESRAALSVMIDAYDADVIAIGNGTASRETESLIAEMISHGKAVSYVMVNEAGASVYSASQLAREELPELDVSMRGAVSIARRLQDPLAELVKIEPRSIGVGQYQHDVEQSRLSAALQAVVESAVNHVGVNLNTASPSLLQYVAGLNRRSAAAIVARRDRCGPFHSREELRLVKGLGPKAFTQAAGFLRISDGDNPLDNTPIHPESYGVCERLLHARGLTPQSEELPARMAQLTGDLQNKALLTKTAGELGVGEPTLLDMVEALSRPGRDPRDDLPTPILRRDVITLEDLKVGMVLVGTVRNIVDFGAFVDIGVKRDGLVHISEMADRFIRSPLEVVKVGDVVKTRVISIDMERGRIGLSMLI